ncbi:MAG: hypothetical protein LBB85_07550 [Dysgonamonadaceae bacterium]|jgi:hypothetical protein|nr:hypothetical protein [Dysgonamonadaceae bacterium]
MKRFILKYRIVLAASVVMLGLLWNVESSFGQGDKWNVTRENRFNDPFVQSSVPGNDEGSSLRGGITPPDPDNIAQGEDGLPLGNAVPFLVGLTLIYGVFLLKNKNRVHDNL